MSISLVLVPLALPAMPVLIGLRLAMGEERFNDLLRSMEIRLPTSCRDQRTLEQMLRAAGYDFQPWLAKWKTHLPMRGEFLTWEQEDGRWVAVFSRSVAKEVVARFISDLEAKSRHIFSLPDADPEAPHTLRAAPIPTNFTDEALLTKTLAEGGGHVTRVADGALICALGETALRFTRASGDPYRVEVERAVGQPDIYRQLLLLDEDYKRNVQTYVYEDLKSRLDGTTLSIETEEVLADNTIVLTLLVEDHA